jgi:hypothetical protein
MCFGSNGVDRVRSSQKILTRLCLANLRVKWHQFNQFCIDIHAVTKRSGTLQNMSFGSNGVDQVRSLLNFLTYLRLANLCVNAATSTSFESIFVQ